MSEPDRRELSFASMDEVTEDIEQLAVGDVRTSGNHSFAEIIRHLAITNEMVIGNCTPPKLPWYMRLAMPFIRKSILTSEPTPGFKLPTTKMEAFFWPSEPIDIPSATAKFRESVDNYKREGLLPAHPIFGPAPSETINTLVLNHAAMHLSFVHPA